jgi:pimeloyl-ACP methyl ester carboxylesterase
VPTLLVGHDRGARVAHHLAIDAPVYADNFTLIGAAVLDIVPTFIQWQGLANPAEGKGFFHWPFLANVDFATEMIQALGGDIFLQRMFDRWRGTLSLESEKNLGQDGSYEVYKAAFRSESVIRASCLDYAAGAKEDIDEEKADQAEGKKVNVPILVMYSASGLGKRFDVPGVWKSWVHEPEKNIVQKAVGRGAGHFFAEENPEETFEYLLGWFGELGVYETK